MARLILGTSVVLILAAVVWLGRPPAEANDEPSHHAAQQPKESTMQNPEESAPQPHKSLSAAELKKRLTPQQYHVTQEKGTERAFTGEYWNTKTEGTYKCVVCGAPLFTSDSKFDSGCGWPSFSAPTTESKINTAIDTSYFMRRTEVTCSQCDAHLGHVFDDGPGPTKLRYCINSASLNLEAKKEPGEAKPNEQKDAK